MILGNVCSFNTQNGIKVDDSNNNTLVGNTCNENDKNNTGTYSGITITDISLDNIIHSNTCNDNDKYGIDIDDVRALRNWVKNNQLRGNTSGPMQNLVTDTKFEVVSFQFTHEINGAIVTTSPMGVGVDAATEEAVMWGNLPSDIQQVMRINIWAVATDTPINAGGQMRLEVMFNAGASNTAYDEAGKSWILTNFDGEEADYVANDVVHWVIKDADVGTELSNLIAGDSFELRAVYEDGSDPDGATDAIFRVIEIEYV